MGTVSKAELVRELLMRGKYTTRKIADAVEVMPAYVRAVKQRMIAGGPRDCDRAAWQRLKADPAGMARRAQRIRERYHSDPDFRRIKIDRSCRWAKEHRDQINARRRDCNREMEAT